MPKVPKKNISKLVADIRPSTRKSRPKSKVRFVGPQTFYVSAWPLESDYPRPGNYPASPAEPAQPLRPAKGEAPLKRGRGQANRLQFKTALAVLFIFLANLYVFNLWGFKNLAAGKMAVIYEELSASKDALAQFNPEKAKDSLILANQETLNLEAKARNYGLIGLANFLGNFIPSFEAIAPALNNFRELNQAGLAIAQDINYLKNNGPELIFNNGGQLIKTLEDLNTNLETVIALTAEIRGQTEAMQGLSPRLASLSQVFNKNYLDTNLSLYKAKDWLAYLLAILKNPEEQHLLVIFQNPSEIRPAGGFIGSHADIAIANGQITKITVDDIYNADRQLDLKIIPPKAMQSITTGWGARDANWFFDFPTSAQKLIYFLENSHLYQDSNTKFIGVTAINVDILKTVLSLTGPLEVPAYGKTLTAENFLSEIQREVEIGRDKKPGQNPKRILGVITPMLLQKLSGLDADANSQLLDMLKSHLANKDILFYFKNASLEDLVMETGVAGEIYRAPENFSGDYLAVVNANIASGKSDAFIKQNIILKSELQIDGSIRNALVIEREHFGQNESDWWYRTENKNYIKILAPANAYLSAISGNDYKPALASINYAKAGYQSDPDLQKIESSEFRASLKAEIGKESDKTYFATWLNVPPGTKKSLRLQYSGSHQAVIEDGAIFQFVFDKQSGVNGPLTYSVSAPIGYFWKESGNDIFEYKTPNPKAREVINLTLVKI
ncbi:MAG: DUF4012 domain-containing protein [bacterium]|nr:DUF4012 domain-containing protein [bacterium]